LIRIAAVWRLKVPVRQLESLTVTDRGHVDDQHRFGVTLTRFPVDPLTNANDPITGSHNRIV
jgi:hypothetical protein